MVIKVGVAGVRTFPSRHLEVAGMYIVTSSVTGIGGSGHGGLCLTAREDPSWTEARPKILCFKPLPC